MSKFTESKKINLLSVVMSIILVSMIALSCGGGGGNGSSAANSDGDVTPEAEATIGPEGGTVEVTNTESPIFGAKVAIPENALTSNQLITIEVFPNNDSIESLNPIVSFKPDGLNFKEPVTIYLPYHEQNNGQILGEPTNAIFTYNESEEVWEIIEERSIDTQNNIVSGIANHFSSFTASADEVRHETPAHLSTGHPILLIHGVGIAPLPPQGDCDHTFMNLKDYLEDMGYDVWSFNYNTARWIEITAGNLERAISGILQQKLDANYQGNKKVTIISHSMGGLVTRAYIQNYGLRYAPFPPMTERIYYNNDIDIVIMTGTPNHGSVWGAINYAAAIEPHARQINSALRLSSVQMIPGSDFLDNLNDTNRTLRLLPTDIDYHLIHGNSFFSTAADEENDGIVMRSSSELTEYENLIGYNIKNHTVSATHHKFLGKPAIALIDTYNHPTWVVIKSILDQNFQIDPIDPVDPVDPADPVISISVTSPTAGAQWQRGTTQLIQWTSSGAVANVQLQLRDNSGNYSVIANSLANTGSYNWAIPASIAIGSGYQIRVSDVNQGSTIFDHSDSFSLTSAPVDPVVMINVTAPVAGTQWQRGTTQTIQWTSSGSVGNVQLQLRDNSGNYSVIANSVANTGSYNWAIPVNGETGSGFKIRVSDVNKWGTIYDHSESFSLTSGSNEIIPYPYDNSYYPLAVGLKWEFSDGSTLEIVGTEYMNGYLCFVREDKSSDFYSGVNDFYVKRYLHKDGNNVYVIAMVFAFIDGRPDSWLRINNPVYPLHKEPFYVGASWTKGMSVDPFVDRWIDDKWYDVYWDISYEVVSDTETVSIRNGELNDCLELRTTSTDLYINQDDSTDRFFKYSNSYYFRARGIGPVRSIEQNTFTGETSEYNLVSFTFN